MKQDKRKRLEAGGWKFSTVGDFLGLTEEESASIERRLKLPDALPPGQTRRKPIAGPGR